MDYSLLSIIVILISVLFTGAAKGGIVGASSAIVPILAICMGGKESVGFLLPISFFASLISAIKYRQDPDWKALLRVLPWAFVGILIAVYIGDHADNDEFFILLAVVILLGCAFIIIQHYTKRSTFTASHHFWVIVFGLLSGLAAMIGNATGPLISTLFILQRFPKKQFVSTYVWFCFLTDLIKIPFHVYIWHSITSQSLLLGLYTSPFMVAGAFLGFWLVKKLPDKIYKNIIITLSSMSAIILLLYQL